MRTLLTLAAAAALVAGSLHLRAPVLAQSASAPVRVGGDVKPPTRTRDVKPEYPPEAQRAGVQGVVILETVVGADGRVTDARVVRSVPLLDEAALAAVRQWEFTPTLLNGVAVPIVMTVTVSFTLGPGSSGTPQGGTAPVPRDTTGAGEACAGPQGDPARTERRDAAVRFAEDVHAKQKTALIARQGEGYVSLEALPGAPGVPDGFDVQLLADGARYALSVKETRDACPFAVFSDQTGTIFVATPLPAGGAAGPPQPAAGR
jgi:TonB family protein